MRVNACSNGKIFYRVASLLIKNRVITTVAEITEEDNTLKCYTLEGGRFRIIK